MPIEQKHWRIAYPNGKVYHIVSSSNVELTTYMLERIKNKDVMLFNKKDDCFHYYSKRSLINKKNGLATIFGHLNDDTLVVTNVFVNNGNSEDAMLKMVSLLDKRNSPCKHYTPIIKF